MNAGIELWINSQKVDWKLGLDVRQSITGKNNGPLIGFVSLRADLFFGAIPTEIVDFTSGNPEICPTKKAFHIGTGPGINYVVGKWSIPMSYSFGWFSTIGQPKDAIICDLYSSPNNQDVSSSFLSHMVQLGVGYSF